jgi:hypothetical protein
MKVAHESVLFKQYEYGELEKRRTMLLSYHEFFGILFGKTTADILKQQSFHARMLNIKKPNWVTSPLPLVVQRDRTR